MKMINDPLSSVYRKSTAWRQLQRAAGILVLAGAFALGSAVSLPVTVNAQESLNAQVERLQRELSALQRQVFRGEAPAAGAAAGVAGGDVSGTQAARIELRLSQFESELRSLTGQIEQFGYKINKVDKRLDSLVADVDLRLQNLEQRLDGGATTSGASGDAGASNFAAAGAATAASGGTAGSTATTQAGAPGTLGTISQGDLQKFQGQQAGNAGAQGQAAGASASGTAQTAALPTGSPQEQYNYAFSLLRQAQYDEAEQALRSFVEQHPEDALAGNAKYWLGETHYVRGDYQQSAVIFAEAYQQYPNNSKAPDNLLKLGMSLGALGNSADACGTFAELIKRYPKAAATVLRRTKQEQQRYSCS
ncbi:tol-pal system protein YbgF [Pelagibius sp. Alg239-R121]|uniref:tol-pal system protein YbgF n=1 Tax=Pelagibius sp. Alg239-R121 TaxID=2993448 RepID=UPI0024A75B90|nr:tol-pal system protein YbgF [Pelagibius sp. Alg239-R121]